MAERPLFADVARPRARVDGGSRTLYLLVALVLVSATALLVADLASRRPTVVVEVDLRETPAP